MAKKVGALVTRRNVLLVAALVALVAIAAVAGHAHVRPYAFWDGPG